MTMPFAPYVLRSWYAETGWQEQNAYSNLTRSSRAILDFAVQSGCRIEVGQSPAPAFANNATLIALGQSRFLSGTLAYFYSKPDLVLKSTHHPFALKNASERFIVPPLPVEPEPLQQIWYRGVPTTALHQMMFGRFYIPSSRLDALWVVRWGQHIQSLFSFVSIPSQPVARASASSLSSSTGDLQASLGATPPTQSLSVSLAHDRGSLSQDYSYSFDDGMIGARWLYNLPRKPSAPLESSSLEAPIEGGAGLRGRWSIGTEIFFSAEERSAGWSAGARFCTVDDGRTPQPPTVITGTINPIMGHLQGAWTSKVGRDLALCSRFDFNYYSYDSEVTIGAEWFQRSRTMPLRRPHVSSDSAIANSFWRALTSREAGDVVGLVKVRASTTTDVRFAWERKIQSCLVGVGISTDWSLRNPVKAVGISLSYWS